MCGHQTLVVYLCVSECICLSADMLLSRFLPWRDGIWLVMKRHEKVHSEFVRNRVL